MHPLCHVESDQPTSIIMTFHGRSNPGKNKCSIVYRHKQGKTFQLHKTDVEEAGQIVDPDPDRADPDPTEPSPTKR